MGDARIAGGVYSSFICCHRQTKGNPQPDFTVSQRRPSKDFHSHRKVAVFLRLGYCGNGSSGAPCAPAGVCAAFISQDTITK